MQKAIAVISVVLAVAQPASALESVTISDTIKNAVKQDVLSQLKNPDSAVFGTIAAVARPGGDVMICGEVNAQNSLGGMTGMLPFIYRMWPGSSELYLEQFARDQSEALRITYRCDQ